jgi:gliding motility-associated-like protein
LHSFSPEQAGWYSVTANNLAGCTSEDSIQIMLADPSDCFLIPGVITPNNDGKNDVWHIQGLDLSLTCNIEIFNRWGNQIFAQKNYQNDWDCRSNCGILIDQKSGIVPNGTYFYILKIGNQSQSVYRGCVEVNY